MYLSVGIRKLRCCFRSFLILIFCVQILLISGAGTCEAQPLPPLHEAELLIGDGPEVLAAIASMGRDEQMMELERQRMGAKYFFNVTYGYSDEPLFETSEESASYSKLGVGAGLSFPIFGTWNKQKISALEAEIRSIESQFRPRILELHNLAALRKAYVTLWSECEKIAIAERFLKTEENTSKILVEREKNGLLLPADRIEFLTAYDMARRDIAVSNMRKTQALQIIRLATGQLWEMPGEMEIPTLPAFNGMKADIEKHPEIAMRKETLKKYEDLMNEKRNVDREGSFTVGATATKDFPGEIGSGVYASVTISEPLGTAFSKEDKIKKAAEHDLKRAQREELFMRIKVQGEAEEAASLAAFAVANIRAQESRLAALTEAVRERIMRHASLSGDTFEQLQKSRYQYYRGVMDVLDSEMIFMQTGADLLGYAYPDGHLSEPTERMRPIADNPLRSRMLHPDWLVSTINVPGGNAIILGSEKLVPDEYQKTAHQAAGIPHTVRNIEPTKTLSTVDQGKNINEVPIKAEGLMPKSVYVWDASPFLAPETRLSSLNELKAKGFDHFLISFTAEQISNFDKYYNRMELEDLLSVAVKMGIRPDLLLGEPTWLYPEERKSLIRIIEKMGKFKFTGVHLDIEPDSLPGAEGKRKELLDHLIDTVKEVKKTTELKLSLSVHPRYFEGELGAISSKGFKGVGIEYVAVMIYTTYPETAARRMREILLMHPSLNFSLAQSVERALPPEESYFSSGMGNYKESMESISLALAGIGRFNGMIIQSWEDIGGMNR